MLCHNMISLMTSIMLCYNIIFVTLHHHITSIVSHYVIKSSAILGHGVVSITLLNSVIPIALHPSI